MATTTTNTTTINTTSNSSDVLKLKTLTEKLRLEISELRAELQAEKCAVRELKVQNDKNLRKHKIELQSREQSFKRQLSETAHNNRSRNDHTTDSGKRQTKNIDNTNCSGNSSDFCENCRKLTNENKTFKQTNKELEERLQNLLEADRLKASDLRAQHENHLIELQRIQRSTRIETQRLLEELKTKDHLIDQLKRRPLQQSQQNRIQHNGKINATNNKSTQTTELMRKLINGRDPTTIDHNLDDTTKLQSNQVVIESITNQCSTDIEHNNNNKIDVLIKQACCYQPTMITTNANESESIIKNTHDMPAALKERLAVGHLIVDDKHEQQQLFTINNNQKQYLKEDNIVNDTTPQSQINKHRKELYYRPLVDIERAIVEEDTDSAVSSAPSSLSPQPYHHVSSTSNSPLHHQYNNNNNQTIQQQQQHQQQSTITAADLWYRHNNGNNNVIVDQQSNDNSKNVIDNTTAIQAVQQCTLEKGELQTELAIAKCQVRELERALLVTREIKNNNQNNNTNNSNSTTNNNDNNTINLLKERIRCLEAHEQQLLRQLQQLREQNELQEFRILELEECHEKWSLRSQSSSELRDIETSRVVTPITNDTNDCTLINDNDNMNEHDLIREHLLVMLNKTQDPDDRHCLQQVTTLLDNLETLSQEHSNCCGVDDQDDDVDDHFNIHIHHDDAIINNYYYSDTTQTTPLHHAPTKQDHDNNEFTKHLILKKKQLSQASSLQESGIFEADDVISVQTQTDLQDLTVPNKTDIRLSELTAEIQKLNKIRASIEENGKKTVNHQAHSLPIHKELEFYKNRLEMLENKINIYESSGDMQMKRLKERLNHEIVLTTQVTDLQTKLNKLEQENRRLEEEKCEFEEAENDTRLQYQQLEIELKMTQEYLHDLEEARNAVKRKLKDAKQHTQYWEQMFTRCEARNYELEEYQLELQCKHDFLVQILPVLILYSLWYYHQNQRSIEWGNKSLNTASNNNIVTCGNNKKIVELMENNKELRKQIDIYKQREDAYIETLQQADNIWAEMETEYKRRIQVIEDHEIQLKTQIKQLEDNDLVQRKNIQEFNERILDLEDIERRQYEQIKYLENEKKFLLKENTCIKDELTNAKNEWHHIKDNLEGACHVEMERLRKKIRSLQDDLDISTKVIEDTEESYQKEISILKIQLQKLNKELLHLDITNSELRELITQLETRISELQTNLLEQRLQSDRTIKNLTSELMSQRENTQSLFRKRSFNSFDQHLSLLTQSTSTSNLLNASSTASQNNVLSLRDELQKSDSNLNNTLH
ncbi:COP1-interactive protein 1 [Chrysoperla carnea]|uniref:COP1-interactive protein 1 n=1 Tax=Chrysoperla carnea TaxID=189513 RepID=UPI001D0617FB|nr:COP1-interactive protein 1 [Chrysoperla carnea]